MNSKANRRQVQGGPNRDPAPGQPLQFSLGELLAATTCLWLLFGISLAFGAVVLMIFVWIASLFVMTASERFVRPAKYVVLGGVLIALSWLMVPSGNVGHRPRPPCTNNVKQLALGLLEYADLYKCFPPAYLTDANGRPMHSWRVLILPYIEEKDLFAQYDFGEPWDGPHNRRLASLMPKVFHCPKDGAAGGVATSYVAVVGPDTLWPGPEPMPLRDIKDGLSNTIMVVEVASSGINWMEPHDLPVSAIQAGISSNHQGAMTVGFADGSARSIQQTISNELLEALMTRAGGETIPPDGY